MKTSFTVNGEIILNIEPDDDLHNSLLVRMHQASLKGIVYKCVATSDTRKFAFVPSNVKEDASAS